ncbi:amidohydrolase family protein [Capnocytophaga genosp. AHN8471]|uniref:Amidohydrolase family protein n=1 Tax=Capnocytophaga periodontitidis TaxID=2795027 RepID=A0ABS0SL63_9FLAO|nr:MULTISPECIES: dihydroorotase [Capnocytophaga]MBI1646202.1 amidohydrolase family protein [Capnocytophaga periodontitidis]MBM0655138.1 amidohydrolase family protein [Capnocytophaga genosp. AHN8471]
MDILLKSARIIDPESAYHNKVRDILISGGVIQQVSASIPLTNEMQVLENIYISQGWTDSSVCFGEPGFEERETLANGMRTAEKSGFTHLLINPLTHPVVDSQSGVVYIKNKTAHCAATAHPIGALTIESKGEYLAELFDMKKGGAVAFGDYKKAISNSNLLKIALQYTQPFGGIVISFPNDTKFMGKGVVNEHIEATRLGLKGIPALAEELMVARDLAVLEYAGGKLHIPTISTAKSVALIREAKAKGLDVSCSVAIHNLHFTDEVLENFNTNYKVLPPLRDTANVQALREALNEGVIDFVTSDHNPLDIELKFKEFDWAAFGTIGLENAFGILTQYTSIERSIQLLTSARKRFGIPSTPITEGTSADMTLFTPEGSSVFTINDILSASKNSAFIGETMKGKVIGVIARNQLVLN